MRVCVQGYSLVVWLHSTSALTHRGPCQSEPPSPPLSQSDPDFPCLPLCLSGPGASPGVLSDPLGPRSLRALSVCGQSTASVSNQTIPTPG